MKDPLHETHRKKTSTLVLLKSTLNSRLFFLSFMYTKQNANNNQVKKLCIMRDF